ncbi:unnamed protein product, partial [Closterium sp. Naga37s-1]
PVDVAQLAMIAVRSPASQPRVASPSRLDAAVPRAAPATGVRHVATFADVAPFLRQLAEEQMQRVLERHHGYLMEALDGAQGFRNTALDGAQGFRNTDDEEVYRCAVRERHDTTHRNTYEEEVVSLCTAGSEAGGPPSRPPLICPAASLTPPIFYLLTHVTLIPSHHSPPPTPGTSPSPRPSLPFSQVVHHLAHLSSVWRPVSPPSRYLRAMSRLVSAALSRCCAHVLALPDISVDETEQLRKLFAGMLTRLPPLFHVDLSGAIGSAHGATSASVAAAADLDADVSDVVADTATLESLVPVYRKLKRLTDLLDMPLVAITQAWESGDLCRCGFTSDEVQRTIRAIFSDTPLRRNCIARVAATMPPTAFQ